MHFCLLHKISKIEQAKCLTTHTHTSLVNHGKNSCTFLQPPWKNYYKSSPPCVKLGKHLNLAYSCYSGRTNWVMLF